MFLEGGCISNLLRNQIKSLNELSKAKGTKDLHCLTEPRARFFHRIAGVLYADSKIFTIYIFLVNCNTSVRFADFREKVNSNHVNIFSHKLIHHKYDGVVSFTFQGLRPSLKYKI